jgi:hypothetical protein
VTQPARRAGAYYEAGRAVMRLELGQSLVRTSVTPCDESFGHVQHKLTRLDIHWLDPRDWRVTR